MLLDETNRTSRWDHSVLRQFVILSLISHTKTLKIAEDFIKESISHDAVVCNANAKTSSFSSISAWILYSHHTTYKPHRMSAKLFLSTIHRLSTVVLHELSISVNYNLNDRCAWLHLRRERELVFNIGPIVLTDLRRILLQNF